MKFLATVCFLLFCLLFCGCGVFAASPRAERFQCQARALQPVVGDVLDAEQLVRDVYTGKASLGSVLGSLKATQAEVEAVAAALQACDPPLLAGEPS